MRNLSSATLFAAMLCIPALAAEDTAIDPKPSEVVGVFKGKAYTLAEVGTLHREVHSTSCQNADSACTEELRRLASYAFADIVLSQTLPHLPNCDLSVSDAEVAKVIAWWKTDPKTARWRHPGADLSHNRPLMGFAWNEVYRWKERSCVYRNYGGGHVMKAYQPTKESPEEPTFEIGGVVIRFPFGKPLDAYMAHFNALKRSGDLRFVDAYYEAAFFSGYQVNIDHVEWYPPQQEARAVLVPFWREVVIPMAR